MHESNTRGTLIEREEVVAQLVAGLLGAGSSTLDTITRGQSAALALGLKDPCFVDLGRSIMVQHEHPEGQVRTVSRPVGLDNVAAAIGEASDTIEDVLEPYLIQQGLLQRTPRGRMATVLAYQHFGLTAPDRLQG